MRRLHPLVVVLALVGAAQAAAATYTLKLGDTLSQVARSLGVSVADLASANQVPDPNRVREGQVLVVPQRQAGRVPVPPSPTVVIQGGVRVHVVEKGDTLAEISKRYGTSIDDIVARNQLRSRHLIRIGQGLSLPGPAWVCPVNGTPRDFADSWGAPRPGGRPHLGTDIFAPRGTAVVANVPGMIRYANGKVAGLAYYLAGDDGHTYYGAHLETLSAPPGRVDVGTVIGTVGTTGNAHGTSPHLHFEIKPGGGSSVNPVHTLKQWC